MKHTKCLIIGSGPAGYTAGIYAARAAMDPVLIAGWQKGGQLMITTDVENFPGFPTMIRGPYLMQQMEQQAGHVGTTIVEDSVKSVDFSKRPFKIETELGEKFSADTIIIATGAQAKWLGIPSEKEYQGYGVSGCATCDGFFYKNKVVGIVGGGDTAAQEALYLTNHASKVYVIHRNDRMRAQPIMVERMQKHPKIEIILEHKVHEVLGAKEPHKYVTGVTLEHSTTKVRKEITLDGLFIAIGHKPSTELFVGQLDMDDHGYIKVQTGTTITSIPGVFAAGDVFDTTYRQAITAAGFGCMAALDAEKFLQH